MFIFFWNQFELTKNIIIDICRNSFYLKIIFNADMKSAEIFLEFLRSKIYNNSTTKVCVYFNAGFAWFLFGRMEK